MLRKFRVFYYIILALLIIGCQPENKEISEIESSEDIKIETITFDENYRPVWWENMDNTEYLYSYAFVDGSDQEEIKVKAINTAQSKFLHYLKSYVISLTDLVLDESGSKNKFKSKNLNSINGITYNKDFSRFLKRVKTDYIPKDEINYRCFVAISLPLEEIQKEYVTQFQKNKKIGRSFAKSQTYQYLLKQAGLEIIPEDVNVEKKVIKDEKPPVVSAVTYDDDVVPAWFKISHNNKKVMVNQTATANSREKSEQKAITQCNKNKMKFANDFARTEAEKYRKASKYDEIQFNSLKNKISEEVMKSNYPLTKEFVKTIQIGENSYKTYAQYSLNKSLIQKALVNVLKSDEILFSRLKASMTFDELEYEDF